jgi:DNA recombination protein RmuC
MSEGDPYEWLAMGATAGAAVAALLTWMAMRGRREEGFRLGVSEGKAETETERATLAERASAGERALAEAKAAAHARITELEERATRLAGENAAHLARLAESTTRLEEERKAAVEKLALIDQAQARLADAFKALSAQSLRDNNQSFLDLAKATLEKFQEGAKGDLDGRSRAVETLVKPLQESLEKVGLAVQELEKNRVGAYASLTEQVKSLVTGHERLASETAKLATALRAPGIGGRWGEIQLKRVVELAGMLDHCDFTVQESLGGEDGRQRPDLIVRLPGGKRIAVDAKAPLQSYLDALEANDEAGRAARLKEHARQVRLHLQALGARSYWERLEKGGGAPEFVVLFLPGETFFSAALQQDPALIEFGVDQRVIVATPTTLIALLRAVAYGWQQERVARSAEEIASQGRELYQRIGVFVGHLEKLRTGLDRAVGSYNDAVGALERRVLPAARKLKELGAGNADELPAVPTVDQATRAVAAEELLRLRGAEGA